MSRLPKPSRPLGGEENRDYSNRRFRKTALFRFDPKSDMTVWELSNLIVLLVQDKPIHFERFFQLPEQLQRHFRHTKNG